MLIVAIQILCAVLTVFCIYVLIHKLMDMLVRIVIAREKRRLEKKRRKEDGSRD